MTRLFPGRIRAFALDKFSEDDLPIALLLIAFGAFACVLPAQSDTFNHLRAGQEMWQSGSLLRREPFSWTSYGRPIANHWWLTQLAFYGLYSLGGPVLVTAATGLLALGAILMCWRLVNGGAEVRFLALLAFGLTLPEWSVRPQVVSLLFTAIVLRLLMADRAIAFLALLMVWANMHAMVVLGIAMAGAPLLDAILWDRSRLRRSIAVVVGAAATPLATPFGFHYWTSLIATVQSSRSLGLQEYRPAFNVEAMTVLFWVVVAALITGIVRNLRRFPQMDRGTRLLVLAAVVLLPTAVMSVRNIPFFALAALPSVSRLFETQAIARRRPASVAAWAMVSAGIAVASVLVVLRWSDGGRQLGWRPLTREAIAAIQACPEHMYNGLYEGGQLIWFVPTRRVFVDGRVEAYPVDFMVRVRHADVDGDYRQLFADYGIRCAVVRSGSTLFAALRRDDTMQLTFTDADWAVFRR